MTRVVSLFGSFLDVFLFGSKYVFVYKQARSLAFACSPCMIIIDRPYSILTTATTTNCRYNNNIYTMHVLRSALTTVLMATSVRAFSPAASSAVTRSTASKYFSSSSSSRMLSSTKLNANVLKLTEPSKDLLPDVDVFIFDCDGVIWRGDSVIPGIPETLDKLRALGKKMYFVTNNSTKSRAGYKKKFDSLGLNVPAEEIFSSSFAAAAYLEQTKFKETGKKVYVVGEVGIQEELDLIGVTHFGGPEDAGKAPDMGPGCALEHDKDVGAVIVGFDRNINYYKIQYAQLCINENPGCEFIATNTDAVTHLTDAQEWAGNGSMVGAIKGCTGQEVRCLEILYSVVK